MGSNTIDNQILFAMTVKLINFADILYGSFNERRTKTL